MEINIGSGLSQHVVYSLKPFCEISTNADNLEIKPK